MQLEGFLRQATKQTLPQRRPGDWAFQRAPKSTSAAWFVLGWFQWMSQTKVLVMKIKTLPTVTANGKLSC